MSIHIFLQTAIGKCLFHNHFVKKEDAAIWLPLKKDFRLIMVRAVPITIHHFHFGWLIGLFLSADKNCVEIWTRQYERILVNHLNTMGWNYIWESILVFMYFCFFDEAFHKELIICIMKISKIQKFYFIQTFKTLCTSSPFSPQNFKNPISGNRIAP